MGSEAAVIAWISLAIAVVSAVVSFVIASNASGQGIMEGAVNLPDPRSDLMVTQTREGIPVPIFYGTVRLAGNILFWGNIESEAVYSYTTSYQTSGGKGGGGGSTPVQSSQFEGYNYYIDCVQGIACNDLEDGVTIIGYYQNDDYYTTFTCDEYVFNDGSDPDIDCETINAHVYNYSEDASGTSGTIATSLDVPKNIVPGSVNFKGWVLTDEILLAPGYLYDDGNGNLVNPFGVVTGTINYSTGAWTISMDLLYPFGVDSVTYSCCIENNSMQYLTPWLGMSWVALKRWFVGKNVSAIPNIQFLIKRTLPTTVNHANMTYGNNPAAIIYDLMTNDTYAAEFSADDINLTKFNEAADYWYEKGYALNFSITAQKDVDEVIEQVLAWVGGSWYQDSDGKYCLHAYDPDDASVQSFTEDDFVSFNITRKGWNDTYNDLRFNFIDRENHYVTKTYGLYDRANGMIVGKRTPRQLDLLAFVDKDAVSRRAWELLKINSYPGLRTTFTVTGEKMFPVFVGCVITISNAEYGLSDVTFRVTKIDTPKIDEMKYQIEAEQMLEQVFDANYTPIWSVAPFWTLTDYTPLVMNHSAVYELPYTPFTAGAQVYAMLAAREGKETGCSIQTSLEAAANYVAQASMGIWSQYGVLKGAYAAGDTIDDATGFLYTPYINDLDPPDFTRTQLFQNLRFVKIDDEIMGFQYHTPEGSADYRVTGVVRGMFGTTIATHNNGAAVWIFYPVDNLRELNYATTFYTKMAPFSRTQSVDMADVTAIATTPSSPPKGKVPFVPGHIEAVRSGSNVTITWWPRQAGFTGAGASAENISLDTESFNFSGDFEYQISGTSQDLVQATSVTYVSAGSFTVRVRQIVDGIPSAWTDYLTVGTSDGTYELGIGLVTY